MALMSQKAYALRIGKSAQYVNKLVNKGTIRRVGRQIDSKQADAALKNSQERVLTRKQQKPRSRPKSTGANRVKIMKPREPRQSHSRSLTEAKANQVHFQALHAELDYKKALGTLLPRDQVLEAERRKNANMRASLRRVARTLAPELARCASAAEAERVLLTEIDAILEQLARDPLGIKADELPQPEAPAVSDVVAVAALPIAPAVEASL